MPLLKYYFQLFIHETYRNFVTTDRINLQSVSLNTELTIHGKRFTLDLVKK